VTDLLRDARGAVCGVRTLESGGRTRERLARFVVGADGLRSVVSRRLGLARSARVPKRIALVTHYRGVAELGRHGEMHVEHDGYVGLAPVDGGLANVAVVVPRAQARAAAGDPGGFLERWLGAHPHLRSRFAGAVRVGSVHATGPFAQCAARAWMPGAALVGDAADFYDPFTGEGIYAALHGGEMLAPALVNALTARTARHADAALATYERARRQAFGGKWKVERLVSLAVAVPMLMNHTARTLARRKDMADLLVGVAGDFVPPREVLSLRYLARLLFSR
jgi:flavin-dependent dehydrogenase